MTELEMLIEKAAEENIKPINQNYNFASRKIFKEGANFALSSPEILKAAGLSKSEWISVEDRLPEVGDEVLVWHLGYTIPIQAYYVNGIWKGSSYVRDAMIDGYVSESALIDSPSHWQPLPQPPSNIKNR